MNKNLDNAHWTCSRLFVLSKNENKKTTFFSFPQRLLTEAANLKKVLQLHSKTTRYHQTIQYAPAKSLPFSLCLSLCGTINGGSPIFADQWRRVLRDYRGPQICGLHFIWSAPSRWSLLVLFASRFVTT